MNSESIRGMNRKEAEKTAEDFNQDDEADDNRSRFEVRRASYISTQFSV